MCGVRETAIERCWNGNRTSARETDHLSPTHRTGRSKNPRCQDANDIGREWSGRHGVGARTATRVHERFDAGKSQAAQGQRHRYGEVRRPPRCKADRRGSQGQQHRLLHRRPASGHPPLGNPVSYVETLEVGKKPRVPVRDDTLRTLIWSPDASRALAAIGNTPDAFGQTWHLPCCDDRPTYRDFVTMACEAFGRAVSYSVIGKWT